MEGLSSSFISSKYFHSTGKPILKFARGHMYSQIPCQLKQCHRYPVRMPFLCTAHSNSDGSSNEAKGRVHFVGIGGSGLSALALLALKQGWRVSGSDVTWSIYMDALKKAGARLFLGHSSAHLLENTQQTSLPVAVVVSYAIPKDNEEIEFANSLGIQVYRRDAWLAKISQSYNVIAVSGSHGKSTTSAMLAFVLHNLGCDITAIVGANVPQFPEGGNAISGQGPCFVLEADEYKECFLGIFPSLAIFTNLEWEHVDFYRNEAEVREAFGKFVMQIKRGGVLIACGDSPGLCSLLGEIQPKRWATHGFTRDSSAQPVRFDSGCHIITYGEGKNNDWRAVSLTANADGGTDYVVLHAGIPMCKVSLKLVGAHNVMNSLAVIASLATLFEGHNICSHVRNGMRSKQVVEAVSEHLGNFIGVCRRFEFVGRIHQCDVYDDYAHHPTEVRAVLQAARQRFSERALWVVFQPHSYSRLAGLLHDFALAFKSADHVIVTKVYAAREKNIWTVSGKDLVSSITEPSAEYIPELDDVLERLTSEINFNQREIVILTLGAGDITTLGPRLLSSLTRT